MIPGSEECINLMKSYGMLENIRAHSIMVAKIAVIVAGGVINAGSKVSMEAVTAGALMHDIGKTSCLGSSHDHAGKGKEICLECNFGEIAEIVADHIMLTDFDPEGGITAKEIVYYSDKRVNHDRIVSLEERMDYILKRYARGEKKLIRQIKENFHLCRMVEKKLFTHLKFPPEDLENMVLRAGNI